MAIDVNIYEDDLPDNFEVGSEIAIDTEAMGLNVHNDRLCLVQIATREGECHLIKISKDIRPAPNLARILNSQEIAKIFHFARFDVALLYKSLKIVTNNIFCTKIASKLARTYTNKHGLKDLCNDLLQIEISKQEQTSDWGAKTLNQQQLQYAATDVLHLHKLKDILWDILARENRELLAMRCFSHVFLTAHLDTLGIDQNYLFSH